MHRCCCASRLPLRSAKPLKRSKSVAALCMRRCSVASRPMPQHLLEQPGESAVAWRSRQAALDALGSAAVLQHHAHCRRTRLALLQCYIIVHTATSRAFALHGPQQPQALLPLIDTGKWVLTLLQSTAAQMRTRPERRAQQCLMMQEACIHVTPHM